MANLKSTQTTAKAVVPSADGATDLIAIFADHTLAAGGVSGDIIEMCPLPAGYVPVDVIVDTEDCGTTWTADVGIMSGDYLASGARTCGAQFMTGKAFGTTGIYRADVAGAGRIAPTTNDRSIGIKGTTIGTPTTGAKIRLTLLCRAQVEGV